MKMLYLDLFSGISGDMFVGALLDLGVDAARLESELKKLRLEGYHLHISRATRGSIEGVKFDVHTESDQGHHHGHSHGGAHGHAHGHEHEQEHAHEHAHKPSGEHEHGRTFADIQELIHASDLSEWVKQKSIAVFQRVAVAEGKVHGIPPAEVHFHEVGAIDSIIDIVGACIGLEMLGRPHLLASAVVEGTGWVDCAHGRFPVPAPATLAILGARGVPITQCDEPHELVTPTGAALVAELAAEFGPMEALVAHRMGFGLGSRQNKTRPNVLRAVLGDALQETAHDWETDTVAVLEANIDDLNPEVLGHFIDTVLAAGALDVFHTPIQMKKNRPGTLLTVLCAEAEADKFSELILRETSSFGVRRHTAERRKLLRDFATVSTPYGDITLKLGSLDGALLQVAPEFESCKKAAAAADVPLKAVYEAALRAFKATGSP